MQHLLGKPLTVRYDLIFSVRHASLLLAWAALGMQGVQLHNGSLPLHASLEPKPLRE